MASRMARLKVLRWCRPIAVARTLVGVGTLGVLLFGAASSALAADLDTDGLDDDWESSTGFSYPNDGDSDEDGLRDGAELNAHTNAKLRDSDRDGLIDGLEVNDYHTNPLSTDTDGDGYQDLDEVMAGTDPKVANAAPAPAPVDPAPVPAERPDRDGDGLFDDDEVPDIYGTNPDVFDTDGDGVGDGEEDYNGTDPLDSDDF